MSPPIQTPAALTCRRSPGILIHRSPSVPFAWPVSAGNTLMATVNREAITQPACLVHFSDKKAAISRTEPANPPIHIVPQSVPNAKSWASSAQEAKGSRNSWSCRKKTRPSATGNVRPPMRPSLAATPSDTSACTLDIDLPTSCGGTRSQRPVIAPQQVTRPPKRSHPVRVPKKGVTPVT